MSLVKACAYIAALVVGRPDIAPALVKICMRESRCQPIGVHARDAWVSRRSWRSQVRLGHLDPKCQPYRGGQWGTRGPWGLSAAAHWQFAPPCYRPEWFDVPLFSAIVAARKWLRHCDGGRRGRRWC